jgi:hypothetical protein
MSRLPSTTFLLQYYKAELYPAWEYHSGKSHNHNMNRVAVSFNGLPFAKAMFLLISPAAPRFGHCYIPGSGKELSSSGLVRPRTSPSPKASAITL